MKKPKKKRIILICIIIITLCLSGYVIWENLSPGVTQYTIISSNLPESFSGFRIAQISDLHNAEFGKDNCRLLNKLQKTQPDIIVLTGDLIDSRRTNYDIAISFAQQAVKIAPTYFVAGNHESRIAEIDLLYRGLENAGVILLLDDSRILHKGEDSIFLTGILDADFRTDMDISEIKQLIAKQMPDNGLYTVLLAHNPQFFDIYTRNEPDLILSGHVHGGQFRIPFLGGLYAPGQGLFPEYDAGLYTKNQTSMIISRGLGNSIFPFRLNNRPEIVVIELVCRNNS